VRIKILIQLFIGRHYRLKRQFANDESWIRINNMKEVYVTINGSAADVKLFADVIQITMSAVRVLEKIV
jgi:hypothetical protein